MSESMYQFIAIGLPPMMTGMLAAVACGLLGNFLVLRRMSLMGDAISHAVLPGLVAAFLIASTRSPMVMLAGALASGLITVMLVEVLQRFGRLESGAAMGVAFSIMFALGVLLLEQAAARHVDLDADCVLYGQLETVFWLPPDTWEAFLTPATFFGTDDAQGLPRQLVTLALVVVVVVTFIVVLFKELRLVSFDPALATALGIPAGAMHALLMTLVAVAAVASFEAVGSILVIAMLICPAATARLLTDRLGVQVVLSGIIAVVSSLSGFVLATSAPMWLGADFALNAAGMMSVTAGVVLGGAILFAPRHGVLAKHLGHLHLSVTTARENLLGALYRAEELDAPPMSPAAAALHAHHRVVRSLALRIARHRGEIEIVAGEPALSEHGRMVAQSIVRSHRLWESYLVSEGGLRPDHVHDPAMMLEHLLRDNRTTRLEPDPDNITHDPHDRPIPR